MKLRFTVEIYGVQNMTIPEAIDLIQDAEIEKGEIKEVELSRE